MNRRQFLVRAAATCGALITPSFVKQALAYIEQHGQPLLIRPSELNVRTLFAQRENTHFWMYFGDPYEEPSALTWRELAARQGRDERREMLEYINDYGPTYDSPFAMRRALDQPADPDLVFDWWAYNEAPNVLAYEYLESLDLGPKFDFEGPSLGQLVFAEESFYGDMRIVKVLDDLSLSLLQARLNELNQGVEIRMCDR